MVRARADRFVALVQSSRDALAVRGFGLFFLASFGGDGRIRRWERAVWNSGLFASWHRRQIELSTHFVWRDNPALDVITKYRCTSGFFFLFVGRRE